MAAIFDVAVLVLARRHLVKRHVGDAGENLADIRLRLRGFAFQRGDALLAGGDLGLQRLGLGGILRRHRLPDLLRGSVAAREQRFLLGERLAIGAVERDDLVDLRGLLRLGTAQHGRLQGFGILTDGADIVHGKALESASDVRKCHGRN